MGRSGEPNRGRQSSRSRPVKVGDRFVRLSVIKDSGLRDKAGCILWECLCDCGSTINVRGISLKRGEYKSCGCWNIDRLKNDKPGQKHGMSSTGTYKSWSTMKRRCLDKSFKDYEHYGGSGITLYEQWFSFENFIKDMGERPKGYTIDRIDSKGNYEPSNCRWADRITQGNNTSRNRLITYKDKTQTMAQWSRDLGIPYSRLRARINILKWSIEKALGET